MTSARLPPSPAPLPPRKRGTGDHKTRKNKLSGYILILQHDYLKVTFLNCLTGSHWRRVGTFSNRAKDCTFSKTTTDSSKLLGSRFHQPNRHDGGGFASMGAPTIKDLLRLLTPVVCHNRVRCASNDGSKPETHDAILLEESACCEDGAEVSGGIPSDCLAASSNRLSDSTSCKVMYWPRSRLKTTSKAHCSPTRSFFSSRGNFMR